MTAFTDEIDRVLDEALDREPFLRCPFCGSSPVLHKPKPHATHPEPCTVCGAETTPKPRELVGLRGFVG